MSVKKLSAAALNSAMRHLPEGSSGVLGNLRLAIRRAGMLEMRLDGIANIVRVGPGRPAGENASAPEDIETMLELLLASITRSLDCATATQGILDGADRQEEQCEG